MIDIAKAWAALIARTENPLAPVLLQRIFGDLDNLGKMLAKDADKQKTTEYSERLLKDFGDTEIETICDHSEFIIAVTSVMMSALPGYVKATLDKWEEDEHG